MNEMSLDNFASTLVSDIYEAIKNEVVTVAQQALINAVNRTVYLQQKSYRQSGDVLGSIEVSDLKIGNNLATFSVGFNYSKIRPEFRDSGWNAHMSMDGSNWNTEGLIDTLDAGSSGSPYYNFDGYGFFDIAEDDMDLKMIVEMANALKGKGYKVTIY